MFSVFLSAGHSSKDPGTSGPDGNESELMTNFRNLVADNLRGRGIEVLIDDYNSWNDPLREAITYIEKSDISIEFHANSSKNLTAEGVEVYSKKEIRSFASKIAQAAANAMGSPVRGENGWREPRESQHKNLAYVDSGGILVELFFISNKIDVDRFISHSGPVAKAIADAIVGREGY